MEDKVKKRIQMAVGQRGLDLPKKGARHEDISLEGEDLVPKTPR
jgi:hypothetical protein